MPFTEGEDVIDDGDDVMDEGANEGNEIIEEDEEQGENYWMKEATKSDRDGGSAGLDGEPLRAS